MIWGLAAVLAAGVVWAFFFAREKSKELLASRDRVAKLEAENSSLREARAVLEVRFEEAQKNFLEQRRLLDEATQKLTLTFQALAGESLKSNNQAFVELARETMDGLLSQARGDFDKKEVSIRNLVAPLEESLKRYEAEVRLIEEKRQHAYGGLEAQIQALMEAQGKLREEAGHLVNALRRPEVRGRYGEITLRRVAELAGMVERCDFTEQVSVTTDDGRVRPDMIIHLPAGREIVVDSKMSLDAYLEALSAADPEARRGNLARHASQLREQMQKLASKSYWAQFEKAPEFVIMFVPGESFLHAALDADPSLMEDGMNAKVILATPTTLIALLRAIAYGWRQEEITRNAMVVADLGRELYERFGVFAEHLVKTRGSLEQTVLNFNKAVGSLETRIAPSVRRFRELGVSGEDAIETVKSVEALPRNPEWSQTE